MSERQIFEQALSILDPVERKSFLDKACGENAALRLQVDLLLAAHHPESEFLAVPVPEQLGIKGVAADDATLITDVTNDAEEDDEDDAAQAPDLSFLQPPRHPNSIGSLGHYEILQVLGKGGFGIVFKAFDEKLHRNVAIKVLSPQLAVTSPPRKRFLREARSVAAIKHENIVQVYSVEEQPLPYLVMEYVEGQTLSQKLNSIGPLEVPEFLHLGRQMAAGLAAAAEMTSAVMPLPSRRTL